jgi:hypothetical protein
VLVSCAPAGAAARFEKPRTVGTTQQDIGHLALAMAANGRAALAAGTEVGDEKGHVVVATRAPGGRFGTLRDIGLTGWPALLGQRLRQPPPLAIDRSGRPMTLEQFEDGCCLRLRAVFMASDGRLRGTQMLTPPRPNRSGILSSDGHGHAVVESFGEGPRIAVATSAGGGRFGSASAVPRPDLGAPLVTPEPDGSLTAVYSDSDEVLVARRSRSGKWSGPRRLFRSDSGELVSGARALHAGNGRTAAAIQVSNPPLPGRVLVAWRGSRGFGKVRQAAVIGDAPFADFAFDGAGRLTVAWVEGERAVRAASARFGGDFAAPHALWTAPEGQNVDYLDVAAGGARTMASWIAYPVVAGAPALTVQAMELRAGRPTTDPQVVAQPGRVAYSSRLALDAKGGGVLGWIEEERVTGAERPARELRAALLAR